MQIRSPAAAAEFKFKKSRIFWVALFLLVHGWGLTQDLTEPWIGMHDWNGAFFSQLARNLLRYPFEAHRGMPMVGVGESLPSPDERSIYATHPPGLVWLVAAAFATLAESEAVARLVPIFASLLALGLLIGIVEIGYGRWNAFVAGAFYSVMPMSVFFGRMVNHEPICLACMLTIVASTIVLCDDGAPRGSRILAWAAWILATLLGIWVDWPAVLFGGLFVGWLALKSAGGKASSPPGCRRRLLVLASIVVLSTLAMLVFIVLAGLDGRWRDLVAIFFSRAGSIGEGIIRHDPSTSDSVWIHTTENFTGSLMLLAVGGLAIRIGCRFRKPARIPEMTEAMDQSTRSRTARNGLHVVSVTGLIWLAAFARQYAVHNYWSFYLGPAVATFAAVGICTVLNALVQRRAVILAFLAGSVIPFVIVDEMLGVRDFFSRESYISPVHDWVQIREMTRRNERVLLYGNHIRSERRGGYHFRNIVPPQMAYYLDRPFDQTGSVEDAIAPASNNRLFVMTKADAVKQGPDLSTIRRALVETPLTHLVVFERRRIPITENPPMGVSP